MMIHMRNRGQVSLFILFILLLVAGVIFMFESTTDSQVGKPSQVEKDRVADSSNLKPSDIKLLQKSYRKDVREKLLSMELKPDTVITLRIHNQTARYGPGDDAFPVFDVTLTGPISQVYALIESFEGTHDGGFEEELLHVYTIPKLFEADKKTNEVKD